MLALFMLATYNHDNHTSGLPDKMLANVFKIYFLGQTLHCKAFFGKQKNDKFSQKTKLILCSSHFVYLCSELGRVNLIAPLA